MLTKPTAHPKQRIDFLTIRPYPGYEGKGREARPYIIWEPVPYKTPGDDVEEKSVSWHERTNLELRS